MTNTIRKGLPTIEVRKFHHRGDWRIGFRYTYCTDVYQSLKSLEGAKYSSTHKCIYIPFTQTAFHQFKKLGFKYIIVHLSEHINRTRQSPPKSEISVIKHSGPINEGGKLDSGIQSTYGLKKIVWQDNHFFIKIN